MTARAGTDISRSFPLSLRKQDIIDGAGAGLLSGTEVRRGADINKFGASIDSSDDRRSKSRSYSLLKK
jgi:hypothetical protein